jgi:hypothetical protein
MSRHAIRKRTMGVQPPTVAVRFERLDFDGRRALDLRQYERENGKLYEAGKAADYRIIRLCDVCPCCGPTPRDDTKLFIVGDVPSGDVPLEELREALTQEMIAEIILEWVHDQIDYDQRQVEDGLKRLRETPRGRYLGDSSSSSVAAFVTFWDDVPAQARRSDESIEEPSRRRRRN